MSYTGGYQQQALAWSRNQNAHRLDPAFEMAQRAEMVLHYAPELGADPNAVLALAESDIPSDALGRAAAEAMTRLDYNRIAAERRARPVAEQRALFQLDPPDRQAALRDAGYVPPGEEPKKSWFHVGLGVPTFVPGIGGKHVTLSAGHSNPFAAVAGGAITAAAIPFKSAVEATKQVGSTALNAMIWGGEAVTGLARGTERAGFQENFMASIAFDRELRQRVERRIGQIDDATWRASVETIVRTPDRAADARNMLADAVAGMGDFQQSQELRNSDEYSQLDHFRSLGGVTDNQIRDLAAEVAGDMRKEGITDTLSWWDAYKETFTGDNYILHSRRLEILDEHFDGDFDSLRVAEAVALGKSPDEIAGDRFDPELDPEGFLNELRRVVDVMGGEDPARHDTFGDAVERLQLGKYSLGREFARHLGWAEGTLGYNMVSGATDGLVILFADPTLGLGKAYKGLRGAAWAIKSFDHVSDVRATAKATLGLLTPGDAKYAEMVARGAISSEQFQAARIAGSQGMSFTEAARIFGDNITWLDRASYEKMLREGTVGKARTSATAIKERGAISNWLAAERIATAFRRSRGHEGALVDLERMASLSPDQAAKLMRSGEVDSIWNLTAFGDLTQDLPHVTGGLHNLIGWDQLLITKRGHGIQTADDVFGYFETAAGNATLMSGHLRGSATYMRENVYELPRLTSSGRKRIVAKQWFNDVIDWTKDASITIDGVTHLGQEAPDLFKAVEASHRTLRVADRLIGSYMDPSLLTGKQRLNIVGRGAAKVVRMGGDFIHSITTMLPVSSQLTLANEGLAKGIVSFERFAELGRLGELPGVYRRLAFDEFVKGKPLQLGSEMMLPGSAATRGQVFRAMIGDLADKLGIADNPEMARYLEGQGVRVYAPAGIDLIEVGGEKIPAAVIPGVQLSDAIAIPDFTGLMSYARKDGFLRKAFGIINAPIVDRFFTKFWKPAMLLRLGFIPRAAGEEILGYVARHGFADYVKYTALSYSSNTTMKVKRLLPSGDEVWDIVPRQIMGGRQVVDALDRVHRSIATREGLIMGPLIDMLESAGKRSGALNRAADLLRPGVSRKFRKMLPDVKENTRRVWIVTEKGESRLYPDALEEASRGVWRRDAKLSYADIPEHWASDTERLVTMFKDNILAQARPVDKNLVFTTPLEPVVLVAEYMAERASVLPRQMVQKFFPQDVVEIAQEARRAGMLHPHVDETPWDLVVLDAAMDAMGEVLGVTGGSWHGGPAPLKAGHVPGPDGPISLRMTREWHEVGADDPMFHTKLTNAINQIVNQDSWAVQAAFENIRGYVETATLRNFAQTEMGQRMMAPARNRLLDTPFEKFVPEELAAEAEAAVARLVEAEAGLPALRKTFEEADKAAKRAERQLKKVTGRNADKSDATLIRTWEDKAKELRRVADEADARVLYREERIQELDQTVTSWRDTAEAVGRNAKEEAIANLTPVEQLNVLINELAQVQSQASWTANFLKSAFDDGIDAPARWIPRALTKRAGLGERDLVALVGEGQAVTYRHVIEASGYRRLQDLADQWDEIPREIMGLILQGSTLKEVSEAELYRRMHEGIRRAMEDPSHAYEMARSHRMTMTSDGKNAALLQPENTERVYLPMLNSEHTDLLVQINESNRSRLVQTLMNVDVDETVREYLFDHVLPHLSVGQVDRSRMAQSLVGQGGAAPAAPIGYAATYSPDLAAAASDALEHAVITVTQGATRAAERAAARTAVKGRYGMVDRVPGHTHRNRTLEAEGRFNKTRVTGVTDVETASRITPVDQRTEVMRYSRTPNVEGVHPPDLAGEIVVPGVGPDVLMDDWADRLLDMVNHHLKDDTGALAHDIVAISQRRRVTYDDVRRLGDRIPEKIIHQELVLPDELTQSLWSRVVEAGFGRVIGPAVKSMIRNPMFLRSYTQARKAWPAIWEKSLAENLTGPMTKALRRVGMDADEFLARYPGWLETYQEVLFKEGLKDTPGNMAAFLSTQLKRNVEPWMVNEMENFYGNTESFHRFLANKTGARAINDMAPYIDDHRFRSQYAAWMRNLTPFWFSEETFLKRWGRTLKHSPEAFRRAQLYVGFLEATGVIQRDQYGQQVFVIPGGQIVQDAIGKASERVFGGKLRIPVTVPMTGQVMYSMPGLDRQGVPSFSPLVAVPFGALINLMPEIISPDETEALFGVSSLNQRLMSQIFPGWVNKAILATGLDPLSEDRVSSRMIRMIQSMEAEGRRALHDADQADRDGNHDEAERLREKARELMFPDDGQPYEVEKYLENVKSGARNLLVVEALFQFAGPTAATPAFPDEISRMFIDLTRSGMPYEEAVGFLLAKDPGATPFTRFGTKAPTGAVIPSHLSAGEWVDKNVDWLNTWRDAAVWAIPQPEPGDTFDAMVYYEQLHMGLRERKTPTEFMEEIKFAEAAPTYFESKRNYETEQIRLRQLRDLHGMDVRDDLDRLELAWATWSDSYLTQHPLFESRLMSSEAEQQRQRTLSQMRLMLADPYAPEIKHRQQLEEMLDAYDELERMLASVKGRSDPASRDFRNDVRLGFVDWAEDYIREFPVVSTFYRSVIEPQAGLRRAVFVEGVTG